MFMFMFSKATGWIWLNASWTERSDSLRLTEPQTSSWWGRDKASPELCPQMAVGTPGRWRRARCSEQYRFMCENQATGRFVPEHQGLNGWMGICDKTVLIKNCLFKRSCMIWVSSSWCRCITVRRELPDWTGCHDGSLHSHPDTAASHCPRYWTTRGGG